MTPNNDTNLGHSSYAARVENGEQKARYVQIVPRGDVEQHRDELGQVEVTVFDVLVVACGR
jgi:hypothetical protein